MSILDRFRLDRKVAVVTGASRGIGAGSAIALAEAGADVLIASRTQEELDKVAARIEELGRRAVVVAADLNDLVNVAGLAQTAYDELGRLDVVVNNVGGTVPKEFVRTNVKYLEDAFHFNVSTAHALTRAAVPLMLRNDGGAVTNISSVMGHLTGRGYLAYGTAKGAMQHYTRLAARDLAPHIRVNAIAVGSVLTSALEFVAGNDELKQGMEDITPLKRLGEVEDIAATVVYLSSPAGGYLTGKIVEADGGLTVPNFDFNFPDLPLEES